MKINNMNYMEPNQNKIYKLEFSLSEKMNKFVF